jgi:hypothetical protein
MKYIKRLYLKLLRDYFAAQAINMWYIDEQDLENIVDGKTIQHDIVSKFNYDLADEMIKQRNEKKS